MIALVLEKMKIHPRHQAFLFSLLIIALSVFMKIQVIDNLSIYSDYDEYYTASTFKGFFDPAYIVANSNHQGVLEELQFAAKHCVRDSGNSLVYNFLGIVLTRTLGLSETGMRLISLGFYCMSLLLVLQFFKKFSLSPRLQIAGIFILCFFSSFSQFSIIIRTYSFTFFLVLVFMYYLFIHAPQNGFKTLLVSLIFTVTLFFSHFLTVFTLILIWSYLVISTPNRLWSSAIHGITLGGLICITICVLHWDWITHFLDMSREIGDETATTALKSRSAPFTWSALYSKSLVFFSKYFFGGNAFNLVGLGFISSILLFLVWIWFSIQHRKNHFILLYNIGGLITLLLVLKSQHFLPFGPKYNIFYWGFWILGLVQVSKEKKSNINLAVCAVLLLNGLGNAYGNWKGPFPKDIQILINGQTMAIAPQQANEIKERSMGFASSNSDTLILKNEEELCLFQMVHEKKNCTFVLNNGAPSQLEIPGFPKYYGPY